VTRDSRTVIAFLVSPSIGAAVAAIVVSLGHVPWLQPKFLVAAWCVAYVVALTLGVPAFLMLQLFGPKSLIGHVLYAFGAGLIPALILWQLTGVASLSLFAIVTALVAGMAFGLIVGRESNQRLERPVTHRSNAT
jgi:hypothetical protein